MPYLTINVFWAQFWEIGLRRVFNCKKLRIDIGWRGNEENLLPRHFDTEKALQKFKKWKDGDETVDPAKIGAKSKETLLNFDEEPSE